MLHYFQMMTAKTLQTVTLRTIVVASLVLLSCTNKKKELLDGSLSKKEVWFRQATVELGAHIQMLSTDDGFAISRGRGKDVEGKILRFTKGSWSSFYSFPYSDFPLIAVQDSSFLLTVNHLTHDGAYRPAMNAFSSGIKKEIALPSLMWDESDHVMWKGISMLNDGSAWMVGQQGHILFYHSKKLEEIPSPLILFDQSKQENVYEGDLNDVAMVSENSGWAVGRNGIIIRYEHGVWKKFISPTVQTLNKISMVNDSLGWTVGEKGTVLKFNGIQWSNEKIETREQLVSVKAINDHQVWIVGNSSTLLSIEDGMWKQNESVKIYDDNFSDISVIQSDGTTHIWIIGHQGIYTNSASTGISFTDITEQASLRRTGKNGIFFHRSSEERPALLVVNDDDINLLYENSDKNRFVDVTSDANIADAPRSPSIVAMGDVNNDGYDDLLEIIDQTKFKFFLGKSNGSYRDWTSKSNLIFDELNSLGNISAKFIDFNNDGNLDLYISNYDAGDMIFAGDGTGRFKYITSKTGITKVLGHASYGATFSDFNNDGLVDIFIPYYVSNKQKFFDLFLNRGSFHFESKSDSDFYSHSDLSPTIAIAGDFNNDGNIDIYIHSQKIPPIVFVNNGNAEFTNVSTRAGLTQTIPHLEPSNGVVACADVNNDGWLDIFDGSKLFFNSSAFKFKEVSEQTGIQFMGNPSFADIDNDGDMDLFLGSTRAGLGKGDRAALFRNNLNSHTFTKLRIHPSMSNLNGVGTKILWSDAKDMKQVREIGLGTNPLSSKNISEEIFFDDNSLSNEIQIIFPSGIKKIVTNNAHNEIIDVYETNFLQSNIFSTSKAIERTTKIVDSKSELIKLFIYLWLLFGLTLLGRKLHAGKLVQTAWFIAGMLMLYLVCLHFFIYETMFIAAIATYSITVSSGICSVAIARIIIERREARYISHYKIIELIGFGGMGKVFKAMDVHTKSIVAIKVLNPDLLKDSENRKRLSAEGRLLSTFDHPQIVKVFEIGETPSHTYIAMEFLSGGTLREYLECNHPLSIETIKKYVLQICAGLSEVHKNNIIHRDLKTGNIMLDEHGTIRIMDFGLSKSPLVTTMTTLGSVLGTLGYVAPEQVTSVNVDQRTDIFSLGVIMYELLTKEMPFKGENEIALIHSIFNTIPALPSSLRKEIGNEWDEIVMKCLQKDIEQRFANVEEVKNKILNCSACFL